MRIVDKVQFVLGIIDIVVGVALTAVCLSLQKKGVIAFSFYPLTLYPAAFGIDVLRNAIELDD